MRRNRMIAALALASALLGRGVWHVRRLERGGRDDNRRGADLDHRRPVDHDRAYLDHRRPLDHDVRRGPASCAPGDSSPAGVAQATRTFIPFVEAIKSGDQACADKLVSDWYVARLKVTLNDPHDPKWITFHPPGGYPSLEDRFKQLEIPIDPTKITQDSYTRPIVVANGQSVAESTDQPQPSGLTLSYPFGKGHLEVDLVDQNGTYLVDGITMNLFQP